MDHVIEYVLLNTMKREEINAKHISRADLMISLYSDHRIKKVRALLL